MHLLARDLEPKHFSFIQSYSSEITLRRDLERVKLINVNNYSSQLNVRLINPCRGRGLGSHLSHLRPFPRVHNSQLSSPEPQYPNIVTLLWHMIRIVTKFWEETHGVSVQLSNKHFSTCAK